MQFRGSINVVSSLQVTYLPWVCHTAVVVFATPFPCVLSRGIVQGCCRKYGARALIDHGPGGCVDKGAPSCVYRVAW